MTTVAATRTTNVELRDLLRDVRHMTALGFDLEERKVLMGHESIRTTERYYGRVTVEDVAAKIAETTGL